jgi:adenine-specific DNA methylase
VTQAVPSNSGQQPERQCRNGLRRASTAAVPRVKSYRLFHSIQKNPSLVEDAIELRAALLAFIADFADWDNSTVEQYLETSRTLTNAAHQALGGPPGSRPLVVDPFSGGGAIPLEAVRVGADAFASDLNPVSALINKVILEFIPKCGPQLIPEIRKWGDWIGGQLRERLLAFYPHDTDGLAPIAYLWARTIRCEGPGCSAEIPLLRSLWLSKKLNRSVALQLAPNAGRTAVDCRIIVRERGTWRDQDDRSIRIDNPSLAGTVKRSSATCPCCSYTTSAERVRRQFAGRRGGADDARLLCVAYLGPVREQVNRVDVRA